jgi:hypothetical protein
MGFNTTASATPRRYRAIALKPALLHDGDGVTRFDYGQKAALFTATVRLSGSGSLATSPRLRRIRRRAEWRAIPHLHDPDLITGVVIGREGGFSTTSDRNAKNEFAPINARDVLKKVSALPLSSWKYKCGHLAPHRADGAGLPRRLRLGMDDKHIDTVGRRRHRALRRFRPERRTARPRRKIAALEAECRGEQSEQRRVEARLRSSKAHAAP